MVDSPKNVHIVVPKELRERLKARKRPHQALAGVIEELLNEVELFDQARIDMTKGFPPGFVEELNKEVKE